MKEKTIDKNLSLTPEQEARYKKISIIGSIVLGLLMIALIASVLGVYFTNRTKPVKPYYSPFETVGVLSHKTFDEALSQKSFNSLEYQTYSKKELTPKQKKKEIEPER